MPASPLLLRPEPGPGTLKEVRWGGSRLAELRGGPEHAGKPIGESWELSTLPGAVSRARGKPLTDWLAGPLPFVVKLIDTAKPLSIQVHPEDDPATGRPGKEEAWVILDAQPGAGLLAGVTEGTTIEQLREAMVASHEDPGRDSVLIQRLRFVEVAAGMCIVVPAGTVHAIGPGITLMEIQQPVDCTYRLFDYGSGRPLQPDDAIAATRVDRRPQVWSPGDPLAAVGGEHVRLRPARGDGEVGGDGRACVVVAVDGDVEVTQGGDSERLRPGDLILARGGARVVATDDALWVEAGLVPISDGTGGFDPKRDGKRRSGPGGPM